MIHPQKKIKGRVGSADMAQLVECLPGVRGSPGAVPSDALMGPGDAQLYSQLQGGRRKKDQKFKIIFDFRARPTWDMRTTRPVSLHCPPPKKKTKQD